MKQKLSELTDKQRAVAVFAALALLAGIGIGQWAYGMTGDSGDEPTGGPSSSEPTVEAASPAPPSPTSTPTSDSSAESSQDSPSSSPQDQDKSAQAALKSLIPKWASMKYETVGTDETKWVAGWKDDPAAGSSFTSQSKRHFIRLFHGVISLEADANVDSLKKIEKVWAEEGQSGWRVQVERQLTNSGGLKEKESLEWEFTVDQKSDGTSEVTAFMEPSSGDQH